MRRKTILFIISIFLIGFPTGCAYFNTYYNAEQYFETAEQSRLEKTDETLPTTARDAYEKVIQKTRRVIEKYPESRYADQARLLMGISQFHLKQYSYAEQMFRHLIQNGEESIQPQTRYWLAMCKWKQGLPQPALDDLIELIQEDISDELLSTIYLSISELYLEREDSKNALDMLEKAATLVSSSRKKSQIYYRLSNLAEEKEDWEKAVHANKQVIKHSLAKSRIMEAHKSIIRIYRLSEQEDQAYSKTIKLFKDDNYTDIHADLKLELGKIAQLKGDFEASVKQFSDVSVDYPGTLASAEAKYLLGEYNIHIDWDLEKAKSEYEAVATENRQSPFSSSAQDLLKYINKMLSEIDAIRELTLSMTVTNDSTATDTTGVDSLDVEKMYEQLAGHRYILAEIKNFQFDKSDLALQELDTLLAYPKTVSEYPKAVYLKSHILRRLGKTDESNLLEEEILAKWSDSEFAMEINRSRNNVEEDDPIEIKFNLAEEVWFIDKDSSLTLLKEIVSKDSVSTVSASALYFLAYQYDRAFYETDSALKYYELLERWHPQSEQNEVSRTQLSIIRSTFAELNVDTTSVTVKDSLQTELPVDSLLTPVSNGSLRPISVQPTDKEKTDTENGVTDIPEKPEKVLDK